jgi:hypothetical protein
MGCSESILKSANAYEYVYNTYRDDPRYRPIFENLPKSTRRSFGDTMRDFNDGAEHLNKSVNMASNIANDGLGGIQQLGSKLSTTAISLRQNVGDVKDAYSKKLGTGEYDKYEGGFFGGDVPNTEKPLDSILKYRKSKSHESKRALAEKIIEALKIAGVSVKEDGDIADIAKAIMDKLPNPHKDQTYKIESESQKNVLKALVKGLNNAFTPGAAEEHKLIRPNIELSEMARQVMEFVYSMTTGVHDEFLTVQASVVNALHNVKVLRKLMDTAHDEVVSQANNLLAHPDRDNANYETYQVIYKRIAKECDRQIEMLSNMLDATMGPETNVLQQLADETSADYKYIKKYVMGKEMDLKTSAKVMAHLVHGISATAVMYTMADKVFEKLGEQMKHLKGATEEEVDNAFDELILKNPAKAAEYIRWKITVKMYNEEQKVRNDTVGKMRSRGIQINDPELISGGAELFEERKNKYDVALTKKTKERQLIFSDFIVNTAKEYRKLLAAIDAFGPKLGSEVPISDKLLDLREAFSRLIGTQMGSGQGKLERALIGFDPEVEQRQLRDEFMNNIRLVKTVVEHLMSMELYSSSRQYFEPVLAVVSKIIEQIDFYYDIIKQKYGSGDKSVNGGDDDLDEYKLPDVSRSSHDLRKSVNSFIYYYYVAKVKENLKQTHSEVASYGENYESLLGEAVACKLKKLKKSYDEVNEQIERSFGSENRLKSCTDAVKPSDTAARGSPEVVNYAYKMNIEGVYKMCKDLNKKEFECKQGFYKALQAVDLYLKEFTENATAHPEDIADIKKMLTGVDLIGPWYDEKTGDHLAHAFDMEGNNEAGFRPLHIWSTKYNSLRNRAEIRADANITAEYANKGFATGLVPDVLDDSDTLQTRESRTRANNLIDAAAAQNTQAVPGKQNQSNHYYENFAASDFHLGNPGIPGDHQNFNLLLASERVLATRAKKQFSNAYDNFQALKNIINAVVRMGDKFGNKEIRNSIFMSPSEIFKGLMGYLKCSTMSFKIEPINKEALEQGKTAAEGAPNTQSDHDNYGLKSGLVDAGFGRRITGSAFVYFSKVGDNSNFKDEDMHFQMIVKAMATKILTVIGMYDLFNRPGPIYDLTPTRMIIGGGSSRPEINPDAAELYFRLVRLAEYYRSDILKFDTTNTAGSQISMIPDITGVFSGFIRLMWLKFGQTTVDSGTYSESELQLIIAECNSIYQHFKNESGEHSVAAKACSEFVMEINRRYGIIKREDFEKFYKMIRLSGDLKAEQGEYNNYSILPGEGELRAKRPAPSDQYVLLGKEDTKSNLKCKTELDEYNKTVYQQKLKVFRNNLNASFAAARSGDVNNYVNISYSERIKQAAAKMRSGNENDKYDVVSQLIRGSQALASTDTVRDYFFHETVVTGINTLCAITKMLTNIREQVKVMKASADAPVGATTATGFYGGNILQINTSDRRVLPPVGATDMLSSIIILVNGLNSAFDGKVKVRFPQSGNSQLLVDFSDLSNSLEDLMDSVKYFFNLMRQHMSSEIIKKYEGDSTTEGTIRWLEANLFGKLLKGRINKYSTNQGLSQDPDTDTDTLESVTKNIDNIYSRIATNYNNMTIALRTLVYNDRALTVQNDDPAPENGINYLLGDMTPLRAAANENQRPNRTKFTGRMQTWDGLNIDTLMRGMLPVFNQLLAIYLTQFYDVSVKKIYRGLIESFASGSFNQAITNPDGMTFTDLFSAVAGAGIAPYVVGAVNTDAAALGGNPPANVLFTSLALILQRMMTDSTREGVSAHLISTLSEVPMYIRERMRANLPVFNKMFTYVQKQGEFIKQLLEQTEIVLGGTNRAGDTNDRTNMITCIDKIVEGCYTLATSAADVYRELADEPKYLQTQENSIRDYQARYGKMPLMPLSSILFYLKGVSAMPDAQERRNIAKLMPSNAVGSPEFKMMYGSRGLLNDKQWKINSAPGVIAALEQFKQNSNIKVDDSKYDQLVGGIVETVRGLVDIRYYIAGMTIDLNNAPYGGALNISNISNRIFKTNLILPAAAGNKTVYSTSNGIMLQRVLAITEGSSQSQQMSLIVSLVSAGTQGGVVNNKNPRKSERFYNIVDMNIIPINVHALMRTIPLAPLYNYTFTFEENARLALGLPTQVLNPTNAREFFYKILEDPYYHDVGSGHAALSHFEDIEPSAISKCGVYFDEFAAARGYVNLPLNPANPNLVVDMCNGIINMLNSIKSSYVRMTIDTYINLIKGALEIGIPGIERMYYATTAALISLSAGSSSLPDDPADKVELYTNQKILESMNNANFKTGFANIISRAVATPAERAAIEEYIVRIIIKAAIIRKKPGNYLDTIAAQLADIRTMYSRTKSVLVGGEKTPDDYYQDLRVSAINAYRRFSAAYMNDMSRVIPAASRILIGIIDSMSFNRHSLDRYSFQNEDRTLAALMHGDESLLMGRPKFISDQLFHKVLPTLDSEHYLTYYANGTMYKVQAPLASKQTLQNVFVNRFNTRVVRNFMHCTNVQRVLRLRLNQELTHYRDVLVDDAAITNAGVTEFGNLRWTDMRTGNTTNNRRMDPRYEDSTSRTYNSEDNIRVAR